MNTRPLLVIAFLAAAPLSAHANDSCPAAVKSAVMKTHAGAAIGSCKQEKVDGKVQYEVNIKTSDGKTLGLDVAPEGAILLTEETVGVASVPAAVGAAFATRYPKVNATAAEKQTKADGKVSYELAFKVKDKAKEATFDEAGNFVSEE
jgi:uncharacterized membrane protein YkoI